VGDTITNLGLLAGQNLLLAYFIVYLGIILIGNIMAFISLWVVFHSSLGPWSVPLLIPVVFLGFLTGDLLWYSFGRALRETRFGHWVKRHLPWHARIERSIERNGRRWMFLARFIYASGFPVIFSIGWSKMPLRKFIRNSVMAILTWLPALFGIAYGLISGLSPLHAIAIFRELGITFFVGLGLFLFLNYLMAKIISRVIDRD
jgi:membrane protein DedA with SNARE-associated domain